MKHAIFDHVKTLLGFDMPHHIKHAYPVGTVISLTDLENNDHRGEVVEYVRNKLRVAFHDGSDTYTVTLKATDLAHESKHHHYTEPERVEVHNQHSWAIEGDTLYVIGQEGEKTQVEIEKISHSGQFVKSSAKHMGPQGVSQLLKHTWHHIEDIERLIYQPQLATDLTEEE